MNDETKCSCQRCGERIAFDTEHSGRIADCPHCGQETTLYIPAPAKAVARAVAAPMPEWQRTAAAPVSLDGLIIAGYLTSIFMPLIGFIIGIVLLGKNQLGSGMVCMILSIIAGAFWLTVILHMG